MVESRPCVQQCLVLVWWQYMVTVWTSCVPGTVWTSSVWYCVDQQCVVTVWTISV